MSICAWFLDIRFGLLFQTRKKIKFKINWIFCPVRNRFLFSSYWARAAIFSLPHYTLYLLRYNICEYPNSVKWIFKLGFFLQKIEFEINLTFSQVWSSVWILLSPELEFSLHKLRGKFNFARCKLSTNIGFQKASVKYQFPEFELFGA